MPEPQTIQVAIDGPVASGCSTVASLLARRTGFLFVDTGAMYRMAALLAMRNEVDPEDEDKVAELVAGAEMDLQSPEGETDDGRLITALLNGEDVSWLIRTTEVSHEVPKVAKLSAVRKQLVKKQQEIAARQNVIMEGRDITYRVLPDAQIKIYLTASETVRAKRRWQQYLTQGKDVTFEEVRDELVERDRTDMNRETDPLKIVPDAQVIDSSDLSIDQVVDLLMKKIEIVQSQKSS